jgi:hypothetical protein
MSLSDQLDSVLSDSSEDMYDVDEHVFYIQPGCCKSRYKHCSYICRRLCLDECLCGHMRCNLARSLFWSIGIILAVGLSGSISYGLGAIWSMFVVDSWDKDHSVDYPGCTRNEPILCGIVGLFIICMLVICLLLIILAVRYIGSCCGYCKRINKEYSQESSYPHTYTVVATNDE